MEGYNCRENMIEALNGNVYGNGTQSLILSHGFGLEQSVWHHVIPYLALFFKVVVYDLAFAPNVRTGLYSSAAYSNINRYASDLVCLMEEMKVGKAVFVGHSFSAMIGCVAAVHRPDLFHHLVLLNGSPRFLNDESDGYYGGFKESDIDTMLNSMEQDYSSWVEHFAPVPVVLNDSAAVTEFKNSLHSMNPGIAHSVAKFVYTSDLRDVLPKVKVPCTVIQTRKDVVVPTSVAYYMKEKLQDGNVRFLETAGHFPQLTAYTMLLQALDNTLHFAS